MRILMINHFPLSGSGSGVYTLNVANSLKRLGHDVCIIMPENSTKYERVEGIKLHPVYFKHEESIKGQLPFNFPCFTTHPNSTTTFFDLTDEQIKLYQKAFDTAIKEEIEQFQPDIIHAQHIWLLSNLATKYDIPTIITVHGTDLLGYNMSDRFQKEVEQAVLKASHLITVSEDNEVLVKDMFPQSKDKVSQMRNGYDDHVFYPKNYNKSQILNKFHIQNHYHKIVCFAGKLTYIKGVDTLLQAASRYETDNIATIIAGNGELYEQLNKLADSLKLKHVYFLGNVNHDTLRELYNISDVSIVPSRKEAFGLVAIEALACGTPVIGTNQGGIPDFLIPEVGSLIEVDDVSMLVTQIEDILYHKKIYQSDMIANYAKQNYSQDNIMTQLVMLYEKLISEYKKR